MKWIWIVLVFSGVLIYLSKHLTLMVGHIQDISLISIVLSIFFLIIGKLLLTFFSKWSIVSHNWRPSYSQILYINSITQLAKYLPGGVWHFAGKFAIYKTKDLTSTQSSRAMLVENLWLILSAFCFGIIMSLFGNSNTILAWLHLSGIPFAKEIVLLFLFITWITGLLAIEYFLKIKSQLSISGVTRLILIQGMVWFFFGLSFWIILPSKGYLNLINTSIGSFALSWAIGYISVFAPSGLEVREIVLIALLTSQISSEKVALYATISRLIWVVTELGLGFFSELMFGSWRYK